MPQIDAFMKTGDLLPALAVELRDADGGTINFTGAATAITFSLRPVGSTTPTIANSAATWVDSTIGDARYNWAGSDSSITAGDYHAEFTVAFSTGSTETFPSDRYLFVRFLGSLA